MPRCWRIVIEEQTPSVRQTRTTSDALKSLSARTVSWPVAPAARTGRSSRAGTGRRHEPTAIGSSTPISRVMSRQPPSRTRKPGMLPRFLFDSRGTPSHRPLGRLRRGSPVPANRPSGSRSPDRPVESDRRSAGRFATPRSGPWVVAGKFVKSGVRTAFRARPRPAAPATPARSGQPDAAEGAVDFRPWRLPIHQRVRTAGQRRGWRHRRSGDWRRR